MLASTAGVSIAREQSTEDVSEVIQVTDEEAELLLQKYRKQEQSVASVHTVTSTPPAEVYIPNIESSSSSTVATRTKPR